MLLSFKLVIYFCFSQTVFAEKIKTNDDLEAVYKKLIANQVRDVKEAASLFDDSFFEKEQYALIFDSLSPQTSSPDAPRVLLFGRNKKLRVGFNHHKKDGQDLEVIQWRDVTQTWEFREIKFTKLGPLLSKANPGVCLQCHDDHKPKFDGALMASLRDSFKKQQDRTGFLRKQNSDPVYKRFK